jgi:6,7-dimethyl-8-ribityllumazine synthase
MTLHEPTLSTTDSARRFGIVVSRYHENITAKLLDGARRTLFGVGIDESSLRVAWVPGAWEIPLAAKRFVVKPDIAAVITLGCVIRGETTHDQHINHAVSAALMNLSLEYSKPVAFGVLTVNSLEQAIHRAGGNVGNKGEEAALAALAMLAFE